MDKKKTFYVTITLLVLFTFFFVGTSYIWFKSNDVNTQNRIRTSYFNVDFLAAVDYDKDSNMLAGDVYDLKVYNKPVFDFADYSSPGDSLTRYIKIKNTGESNLDYFFEFSITNNSILRNTIKFNIEKVFPVDNLDFNVLAANVSTLQIGSVNVEAEEYEIYKITVSLLEDTDNTYNTLDGNLAFGFDILLYAWESNEDLENDFTVLLDNINIINDYRRFKFVLPEEYLTEISDDFTENYTLIESRLFNQLLVSRPETGFLTISDFKTIFNSSLSIHSSFFTIEEIINNDETEFSLEDLNDIISILQSESIQEIILYDEIRSSDDILQDLTYIHENISINDQEDINDLLSSREITDFFDLIDILINYIEEN